MSTQEERRLDASREDRCKKCRKQFRWDDRVNIKCLDEEGMCLQCCNDTWGSKPEESEVAA